MNRERLALRPANPMRALTIPLGVVAVLTPAAARGQPVDPPAAEGAKSAFEEARAACEADGGELWGVSLCGPILLADTLSGRIFGNEPAARILSPSRATVNGITEKRLDTGPLTRQTWGR